ncbi:MAG: hypothetical protein K2X36_04895, partial [Microbacteriaceae bacterium]|nr:hypothetical protein [Microbacteriaceae bacterium]
MRGHTHTFDHDCGADEQCRSGTRNQFFPGRLMKAGELRLEQAYGIDRRRLLNRALYGWGVVYGLALERRAPATPGAPPPKVLRVGRGLALDRYGREIVVAEGVELDATNTFRRRRDADCRPESIEKLPPGRYLLAAHYAERAFCDAIIPGRCGCEQIEKKFVCETAVFSLTPYVECPCNEPACNRHGPPIANDACGTRSRGPHATLCRWSTDADVATEPERLCEWQGFGIDPRVGVPLGCLDVAEHVGRCDPLIVPNVQDGCGPRRLVKNNDLLYDLIRGCDLSCISFISWEKWHRSTEL